MNLLASEKVVIRKDAKEIFEYVSNMENFSDWFVGVDQILSLNDLAHGVSGKSYLETVKIPFKGRSKVKITVVEADSPTIFVTEGSLNPIKPRMEISIKPLQSGNEVTWSMYSRNDNFLFKRLMLPLVRSEMTKRAKRSVNILKEMLDG